MLADSPAGQPYDKTGCKKWKKIVKKNKIVTNPDVISTNESTRDEIMERDPDRYEATDLATVSVRLISNVKRASVRAVRANFSFSLVSAAGEPKLRVLRFELKTNMIRQR